MPESQFERLMRDPKRRRLYEQERLLVEATELIAQVMQGEAPWQLQGTRERGLSFSEADRVSESTLRERQWAVKKAELAERLGKSKAYVTQVLSGSRNMTLRTLADFAFALGFRVELRGVPLDGGKP